MNGNYYARLKSQLSKINSSASINSGINKHNNSTLNVSSSRLNSKEVSLKKVPLMPEHQLNRLNLQNSSSLNTSALDMSRMQNQYDEYDSVVEPIEFQGRSELKRYRERTQTTQEIRRSKDISN